MNIFRFNRIVAMAGVTALVCLTVGCSDNIEKRPFVKISGAVTLDGDVIEQGSIQFRSSKTGESAYTNLTSDGHYSLIFPEADLETEYNVSIGPPINEEQNAFEIMKNPVPQTKNIIPQKYSNFETSGLKAKFEQAGKNEVSFELTSK